MGTGKEKLFGVGLLKVVAGVYNQVQDLEGSFSVLEIPGAGQFRLPASKQTEL